MADLSPRYVLLSGLRERINNLEPLMKDIGKYMVTQAQRAFVDKKLGEDTWPTRYPNQREPFVNIAAALNDLNRGTDVKGRRLDREPVLQDRGFLFRGIEYRLVGSDTVETGVGGPAKEYANIHNRGLESKQEVTQLARDTLAKQIKKVGRAARKKIDLAGIAAKKGQAAADRAVVRKEKAVGMAAALRKLGFLFHVDELVTKVNQRPFIGIVAQTRVDVHRIVLDYIADGKRWGA